MKILKRFTIKINTTRKHRNERINVNVTKEVLELRERLQV